MSKPDRVDLAIGGLALTLGLLATVICFARVEHPRPRLPTAEERVIQRLNALEAWRENHSHQLADLTARIHALEGKAP